MKSPLDLKKMADALTAIRLAGASVIPVLGIVRGPSVVAGSAGWLLILLWLTDLFDGKLARKSGHSGEGFFGRNDGWVDLALALASFTLLAITGFVSPWFYGIAALVIVVLCFLDSLIFQGLTVFFLTVLYFAIAYAQDPTFLFGILMFLGIHAILSRERFAFLVSRFLKHTKEKLKGN